MATRQRANRRRATSECGPVYRAVLTAVYTEDRNGFTGYVVELLGISAEGRTLDETRERLESAARGYLEFNQESVRRRLEPSSASTRTETFTVDL